jgi:hypothetical protein
MTSILVSESKSEATGHISKIESSPYDWFYGIDELEWSAANPFSICGTGGITGAVSIGPFHNQP